MSDDRSMALRKGEEVLNILNRGAEFTRDLLRENERLRDSLARVEDRTRMAAQNPDSGC